MIRSPRMILALFTGLNLLNYLDRLVLSAVLPHLQEDLGITSFFAGLLGTLFMIGYLVTSPLFGRLGDTASRKHLIALGVLVWSVATFATGLAKGMFALAAARAFVGVGEASYATLAPTIIDDIAPPEKRGKWLSIFYAAMPIGSALGYVVGASVEARFGWRTAFFVAGGPGALLAISCLFIEEPARGASAAKEKPNLLHALGSLTKSAGYVRGVLGYCAYSFAIGGFAYWAPTFIFRRYDLSLQRANVIFGLITVVSGFTGTILGGIWADRTARKAADDAVTAMTKRAPEGAYREPSQTKDQEIDAIRDRASVPAYMRVCAMGSLAGVPLTLATFLAPSATIFFVIVFFCEVALFLSTSPINAVILRSVPNAVRASAMAGSILAIHILGDVWSPPLVGVAFDHFPPQIAMMSLVIAIGASAAIWWKKADGTSAPAR